MIDNAKEIANVFNEGELFSPSTDKVYIKKPKLFFSKFVSIAPLQNETITCEFTPDFIIVQNLTPSVFSPTFLEVHIGSDNPNLNQGNFVTLVNDSTVKITGLSTIFTVLNISATDNVSCMIYYTQGIELTIS